MGNFNNIITLASMTALTLSCQDGQKSQSENNEKKPNFIFIVSEDNSPFLGCYGDVHANTPNLDKLAEEGILYQNAFAVAPVSAPSRSSIITGMYANSLGGHHMRSHVTIPEDFRFFPHYLQQAGYHTVNRQKKDYNIVDQPEVWDNDRWWNYSEMLEGREDDQPFFAMFNTFMSHESKIHGPREDDMLPYYKNGAILAQTGTPASKSRIDSFNYMHKPGSIPVPPYHPQTPEMKADWARYYDCISMMDDEIGELLANLEKDGHLDNTIVFYFSDHGGVLGRSKRFLFESGLHVPFIVRFPEKYEHLAPANPGSKLDRIISFVDLAPTLLNLANIDIPEHFQGIPFLGENSEEEKKYAFGFRGRMDERYDFSHTSRSKEYRYIRNYMPHRPWGQHLNYLWKAESMPSWEEACKYEGCNEYQSRFWGAKPVEELYKISTDPHNIHNLAYDPDYRDVLEEHRKATDEWLLNIKDKSFIPEGDFLIASENSNGYDVFNGDNYDLKRIKNIAKTAISGNPDNLDILEKALKDNDPIIRYWGVLGCRILEHDAENLKDILLETLSDDSFDVRIASAEALYFMGEKQASKDALKNILQNQELEPHDALEKIHVHALNVISLMKDEDIAFFENEIKKIYEKKDDGSENYKKALAEYIVSLNVF